jgi:hypothetical protein
MSERTVIHVVFDRTPECQQTGFRWRVKPHAARRLRRSLTGRGLTRLAGLLWPGRGQPQQKETEMSSPSHTAPTERQLRYLRVLASATATTFESPATRAEASRQIDRLRKIERAPHTSALLEADVDVERLAYATAVHPDEVDGYGSSARWRVTAPPGVPEARAHAGRETQELARYKVSAGERVLFSERGAGGARITDRPASGTGRSYVVERDLVDEGGAAREALLADYVRQARRLDEVPMASAALRQMLEARGTHV